MSNIHLLSDLALSLLIDAHTHKKKPNSDTCIPHDMCKNVNHINCLKSTNLERSEFLSTGEQMNELCLFSHGRK